MKVRINNKTEIAKKYAIYLIENKSTVRKTAKNFNTSKSTVYRYLINYLKDGYPSLANDTRKILEINKKERYMRGGLATKQKYIILKNSEREV